MQVSHQMAENVDCVKELGHDSRRIITCAIANMLRISLESQEQKDYHVNMRQDLQKGFQRLGLRRTAHKSSKSHLCKTDHQLQAPRSKTSALKCEQHSHWFQTLHFAKCLEQ